jgi:hypothetical protein
MRPQSDANRESIRRWLAARRPKTGSPSGQDFFFSSSSSSSSSSSALPEHDALQSLPYHDVAEPRSLRFSVSPSTTATTTGSDAEREASLPPGPTQMEPPTPHARRDVAGDADLLLPRLAGGDEMVLWEMLFESEAACRRGLWDAQQAEFALKMEVPMVRRLARHTVNILTRIIDAQDAQLLAMRTAENVDRDDDERASGRRRRSGPLSSPKVRPAGRFQQHEASSPQRSDVLTVKLLDVLLHELSTNIVPALHHVAVASSVALRQSSTVVQASQDVAVLVGVCQKMVDELRLLRRAL